MPKRLFVRNHRRNNCPCVCLRKRRRRRGGPACSCPLPSPAWCLCDAFLSDFVYIRRSAAVRLAQRICARRVLHLLAPGQTKPKQPPKKNKKTLDVLFIFSSSSLTPRLRAGAREKQRNSTGHVCAAAPRAEYTAKRLCHVATLSKWKSALEIRRAAENLSYFYLKGASDRSVVKSVVAVWFLGKKRRGGGVVEDKKCETREAICGSCFCTSSPGISGCLGEGSGSRLEPGKQNVLRRAPRWYTMDTCPSLKVRHNL